MFDTFRNKRKTSKAPKREIPKECSPDGSPIYRYEDNNPPDGLRPPAPMLYGEELAAHMEKAFPGREMMVFHELMSDLVHIDVTIMKPTEEEDFYVLFTTGMSDLPMTLPDELLPEYKHLERAELMLFLPGDWDFGGLGAPGTEVPEEAYWPVRLMKFLARFPHEYQTWFGFGHTIPNDAGYTPYASDTMLSAVILVALREEISEFRAQDGTDITIYMIAPLYEEETEYKLEHGADAIIEKLLKRPGNPWIVDPHREMLPLD